jgi:molybdate transport system regulatory protein
MKRKVRKDRGFAKEDISVRVKLWLEIDGKPFFGEGRFQLLKGIDQYSSINQAAKAADIPYRKAWSYLHAMEKRLGTKMLNTQVGGPHGGGTRLSEEAKEFLTGFEHISSYLERFVEKEFSDFLISRRYAL